MVPRRLSVASTHLPSQRLRRWQYTQMSPYSWSDRGNSNRGFAQQRSLFGCVQICVFGDGVQGKGRPSPASAIEKLEDGLISVFFQAQESLRRLCELMRMKFSAGFLQWELSGASRGYESYRPTRDVPNQNLEPRAALCFANEYSDEVRNRVSQEGSL